MRLVNNQGSATGNDHAFDNIRILDATPQLDKAFSPATIAQDGVAMLTFTITNTSELGAKNGWSFTDTLPVGVQVANPAGATTTCTGGVVTATAGGSSVAVNGNLNVNQASCTASVNVTASALGTYTNGPGNATEAGLNPLGNSSLTVDVATPTPTPTSTVTPTATATPTVTSTPTQTPTSTTE